MKKRNNYINILLVLITVIQVLIFIKFNLKKDNEIITDYEYSKEILTFKNVNDHLLSINGLKVLEIEYKGESWNAKVRLTGNEENIKENLNLLKKYRIIAYNIDGSNGDFNVTLDMIRKYN